MKQKFLIIIAALFVLCIACKKEHSNPDQQIVANPDGDTPLSKEDNDALENMSAPLSVLDHLLDYNGNPLGKTTGSSIKEPIINHYLSEAKNLCQLKNHKYPSDGPDRPEQFGIVYSAGQNDYSARLKPKAGNALHRKYFVYGTDCSGLVVTLLQNAGINLPDCGVLTFEETLRKILKNSQSLKRMRPINLGNIQASEMKGGDFILWRKDGKHHMGIISLSDNAGPIILQSNGTDTPIDEKDQQNNWGPGRGVHPLAFSKAASDPYWGQKYEIVRLFEAGEMIGGGYLFYINDMGTEALVCATEDQVQVCISQMFIPMEHLSTSAKANKIPLY